MSRLNKYIGMSTRLGVSALIWMGVAAGCLLLLRLGC